MRTRGCSCGSEWNVSGKNASFLLPGYLRSAEQWLAEAGVQKDRQPTVLQAEYVLASKEDETQTAIAEKNRISAVASRGIVALARHSKEAGKNTHALAQLAQALRLKPDNREALGLTVAILTQSDWHVPLAGSMRHGGRVICAEFAPDGQRAVTASSDGAARLWDAASGEPIGEPMRHEDIVYSPQFSPDGRQIVTASG